MEENRGDLARTTLGVLFIGSLMLASLWILRPFIPALIWATTVVVATWPILLRVQRCLRGRRSWAVAVMTVAMLTVFFIPLLLAVGVVAEHGDAAVEWLRGLPERQLPPAPDWLRSMPVVGDRSFHAWQRLADGGWSDLAVRIRPYVTGFLGWLVAQTGAAGLLVVQCLLIVIVSIVLYAGGEAWGAWMIAFGRQLAADRGEEAMRLAGRAIRGVAMGVIVTAFVQSVLGGIGLIISGVPFAGMFTAIMFVLCIAQVGPLPILLICTGWLFAIDETGWGGFLLVWSIGVGVMDNLIRPFLIRRGADLPLMLIFAGVIGGLLSFGLVGLFVGPVVLAVAFTLVDAWVRKSEYR